MTEHILSRTLVKSPPELWAEVSDPATLADHLGEFGEIRITRVEQESSVAWEGERASGTVELEPTKWGTRVRVTACTERGADSPEGMPANAEASPPVPAAATAEAASEPRSGWLARLLRRRPPAARPRETAGEDTAGPVSGGGPADLGAVAVLFAMLDTLGSAKHRPFSRG